MATASNSLGFPLVSIILWLPVLAGLACWLINDARQVRIIAVAVAVIDFLLALFLLVKFELPGAAGAGWTFQFADHRSWISTIGVSYWVGVDGVSVLLVALATLMMAVAILATTFMVAERQRLFLILMLFLETAIIGVFVSINLFLFFVFWEAMLIPSYFLLGVWGEEGRVYATMKFVIYTILGSFLMLVGIFYLWSQAGTLDMAGPHGLVANPVSQSAQNWLFLAFGLAFAIKTPLFPFHAWAPTAYSESPLPFLIALAGILSKAGAFGFIRYSLPLFPAASHNWQALVSVLAIIGLLYAAVLALVQTDIKKIVAYASISHMNLIVLGIFTLNATGLDGSVLQMVNHSIIISGLFLAVAYIFARTGTRFLDGMGGLGERWPWLMWLFFVFVLAGLDLPGLGSFAGEVLIFLGVFAENAWFAVIGALVTILAAWYMIRFFQNTMNGPVTVSADEVAVVAETPGRTAYQYPVLRRLIPGDLLPGEIALFVPLIILIIYIGIQPYTFTQRINPTMQPVSALVNRGSLPGFGGGR
jgi:NADH-quinone oxidoreductase subunit M